MTREEAIKVLRTESVEIGGNTVSVARWLAALDAAVKALDDVPDIFAGKNEPLTLDELRQMDETVWVCYPQPTFGANLLTEHMECTRYKFSFADYGKTWLAYRQKPEEGTV